MSEARSYNLLCQPWIPVVWRDNAPEPKESKVGIQEALERAHKILCISHTSPFIEFGLYRLLITIVLDAYIVAGRRPTIGKMRQMLASGQFDASLIGDYLEKYKQQFELWGDGERFLQRKPVKSDADPVAKMVSPIPSGTKITHWHHYSAAETKLSEAEAALELCAVTPFCFDYAPADICTLAGDPPLYVIVEGESLFQTIALNLPRPSGRTVQQAERDLGPMWRTPVADTTAIPASPTICQGWTWPVRNIWLSDSDDGLVSDAVNTSGARKTEAGKRVRSWRDPNAGTITKADGLSHIRAEEGMVLSRDLLPLFLIGSEGDALKGERRRSRPEVVTNALRASDDRRLNLSFYGFIDKGGKNNKVFRTWLRSAFSFPTEVARDERLSYQALDAFNTSQKVADALQVALRMLRPKMAAVPRERKNLRNTQRGETDAIAGLWQLLEPALARTYLDDLAAGNADAMRNLKRVLRREARNAFRAAAAPHRRDADGLFRIANAGNYLERQLARLLSQEKNS
jgi:CRISPR type I-E-associated protein CasA/Cse1